MIAAWLKRVLGFETERDDERDDVIGDFVLLETVRTGVVVTIQRRQQGLFIRYGNDPWIRLGPVPGLAAFGRECRLDLAWLVVVPPPEMPANGVKPKHVPNPNTNGVS